MHCLLLQTLEDKMKAGISTACLYPMLVEEALHAIAMRNVKHAEIFINTDCELYPPIMTRLKEIVAEYDMKITSLHPYTCGIEPMMLFTEYPRRIADITEYYKRFFNVMNEFGARIFVLHGNKADNAMCNERAYERYALLADVGDEFGVTVAQENVSRCSSGKLEYLKGMSDYLGDRAAFVLDTKQALRAGESALNILQTLGKRVVHIHYSDSGEQSDCMMYKQGSFDNKAFFDELKRLDFHGRIILELYRNAFADIDSLTDNYRLMSNDLKEY